MAEVVHNGAASFDFFGTAYGQLEGKYDGFQFGSGNVSFDDTLLLIEPEGAKKYANEQKKLEVDPPPDPRENGIEETENDDKKGESKSEKKFDDDPRPTERIKSFRGSVEVNATRAKSRLITIADEVISLLVSDPNATIRITLEIDAEFANGVIEPIKRAVSENATSLGIKTKDWE